MTEINFITIFVKASLLVKFIILLLLLFSVISWAIIIRKAQLLHQCKCQAILFENKFWSGTDLVQLYRSATARREQLTGSEHIFYVGFKEFSKLYNTNRCTPDAIMNGVTRVMRVVLNRELEQFDYCVPFLATIGTISPYIGLLGTIGGIMQAFMALGSIQQATLQIIAPSIAEALVTTAIGLIAAIPSIMAYNRFNTQINKMEKTYTNFMEELTSILYRQTVMRQE